MRWLIVLVIALVPAVAHGRKVVIPGPAIAFSCPANAKWEQIADCFKQHQWTFTVARSNAHAKLLAMHAPAEVGLALYMQKPNGTWSLSGLFETGIESYDVLGFEPITIGHTNGIRIDVGVRQATTISTDGQTTFEGVQLVKNVLFCSGLGWVCSQVVVACDIFADGREYAAFHGAARLIEHEVDVDGVGTTGSMQCATAQKIALTWP